MTLHAWVFLFLIIFLHDGLVQARPAPAQQHGQAGVVTLPGAAEVPWPW